VSFATIALGLQEGTVGSCLDDIAAPRERADRNGRVRSAMDEAHESACAEPEQAESDGGLCGAMTGEDRARFARMVLPHLDEAYTLAQWITGDGIDAEDVVQEACLRAFRATATIADDKARTAVLASVRNAGLAWLRKYRPAALVAADEFGPSDRAQMRCWDSDQESPEAALIAKTDAATLEAAIDRLPRPFREALVMRDLWGLSYREIAERAGVPIGTVMSRLARGRNRVIKAIGIAMARGRR
jgi:RNA polymerase sigma-70 factor (ECF subfamily)